MEVTVNDPDRVTDATVDANGRVSGLSDFKNQRVRLVVKAEETEESQA